MGGCVRGTTLCAENRKCGAVLRHLDAAYNLARWLTNNDATAEDAVQDACVRAFRFFDAMHKVPARRRGSW